MFQIRIKEGKLEDKNAKLKLLIPYFGVEALYGLLICRLSFAHVIDMLCLFIYHMGMGIFFGRPCDSCHNNVPSQLDVTTLILKDYTRSTDEAKCRKNNAVAGLSPIIVVLSKFWIQSAVTLYSFIQGKMIPFRHLAACRLLAEYNQCWVLANSRSMEAWFTSLYLHGESRQEGVDRRKLKFINLEHNYKPGLALEINLSPKERGKQINQRNIADDTVICFTEVRFQRT
jgi:hypothetical protein